MNEEDDSKVVAKLDKNVNQVISTRRVFVGGLPQSFGKTRMLEVNNSLNGCVRELVVNK